MKMKSGFVSCALHCFLKNDFCPLFNPSAPKRILRNVRANPLPKRIILAYSSEGLKIINDAMAAFPASVIEGYYLIEDPRKVVAVCLARSEISQQGYLVLGFTEESERRRLIAALDRLRAKPKVAGGKLPVESKSQELDTPRLLPRANLSPSEHWEINSCHSESVNGRRYLTSSHVKPTVIYLNRKSQANSNHSKNDFIVWDEEERQEEGDRVREHFERIREKKEQADGSYTKPYPRKVVRPYSQTLFKRFLERQQSSAAPCIVCDNFIVYKPRIFL